jgi:antitoxin component of MazEF toxin-antitoxin module
MIKEIKQLGNSQGITFSPEEKRIYDLNLGDVIEVEVVKVKKGKKK